MRITFCIVHFSFLLWIGHKWKCIHCFLFQICVRRILADDVVWYLLYNGLTSPTVRHSTVGVNIHIHTNWFCCLGQKAPRWSRKFARSTHGQVQTKGMYLNYFNFSLGSLYHSNNHSFLLLLLHFHFHFPPLSWHSSSNIDRKTTTATKTDCILELMQAF